MRQFFGRLSGALSRFFYGRNGADQLGTAMLAVYLVLCVLRAAAAMFTHSHHLAVTVFDGLLLPLAIVIFWRCLSKNLEKRRAENARFLAWWGPRRAWLTAARARRQDRDHRYFTCRNCGAICRVPAGKGRIEIACPRCGGTRQVKS